MCRGRVVNEVGHVVCGGGVFKSFSRSLRELSMWLWFWCSGSLWCRQRECSYWLFLCSVSCSCSRECVLSVGLV